MVITSTADLRVADLMTVDPVVVSLDVTIEDLPVAMTTRAAWPA